MDADPMPIDTESVHHLRQTYPPGWFWDMGHHTPLRGVSLVPTLLSPRVFWDNFGTVWDTVPKPIHGTQLPTGFPVSGKFSCAG